MRWLGKIFPNLVYYKAARRKNGNPTAYLHQSIVVAEVLHHDRRRPVHYLPDLAQAQIELRKRASESQASIVFLNLNGNPEPEHVNCIYRELEAILGTHHAQGSQIIPSRMEWEADKNRWQDIEVLEIVAKKMGSFRPKTCFANFIKGTECTLTGDTVTKETYTTDSTGFKSFLHGELPPFHGFDESNAAFKQHIIHQEHVPSLKDFGEFRIWFTTRASPDSPLQREVVVERVIKTSWADYEPSYLYPEDISEDVTWKEYPDLTPDQLKTYGKEVYSHLLDLNSPFLESLKVAGRLDIGVSPDGKGFFVVEIGRPNLADMFSEETLPKPHDQICKAVARAFNEVYPGSHSNE